MASRPWSLTGTGPRRSTFRPPRTCPTGPSKRRSSQSRSPSRWRSRAVGDYIVWLDGYHDADRIRVGGKNASLGEMMAAGLPVPPGFAITIDAYQTLRRHADLRRAVGRLLAEVDLGDAGALEEISAAIRRRIELVPLDDGV